MDWNAIIQNIGSVGFPIVACGVMFSYLEKERETHRQEIASVTTALNENTKIIAELKDMIKHAMKRGDD